jgi:hypothetical protein
MPRERTMGISLPPHVEGVLRARAAAEGRRIASLAALAVESWLATTPVGALPVALVVDNLPADRPEPPSDNLVANRPPGPTKPRRRNRASRIVVRRLAGWDGAEEPISPDELAARDAKRKAEKAAQRQLQRQREAAREGTVRRGRKQLEVS